jgi:ubiquinone/menaquinone biosynthesis C-methylase UbiE
MSLLVPSGYVLGVDKWFSGVIQAIFRFPRETHPNLRFLQADARHLKLAEEPFDFVVSRSCLHFLEHPGQAFIAIARHLKPGGCMHMWCMGKGNAALINKSLRGLTALPQWKAYFQDLQPQWTMATPISCDPWLNAARLKKNQSLLINQEVRFADRWEFLQWVSWSWGNYFERVPAPHRQEFSEQFLTDYCTSQIGAVSAHLVWLVVDATKR